MYNLNQLKNYATILKSGKETFWASDFGFRGGDIHGLTRDFIDPTGNEKETFVDVGGNMFKKVTIKELTGGEVNILNAEKEERIHGFVKELGASHFRARDKLHRISHLTNVIDALHSFLDCRKALHKISSPLRTPRDP